MKKYIVEFIGTFFLVLTIGMCVLKPDAGSFAPIAIGAALMVMVYAGGHISGAHYNPAVTLAVVLRGRCKLADVPGYLIAQLGAAVAASLVVLYFKGDATLPTPGDLKAGPALLAEFLGTFALAFVILKWPRRKPRPAIPTTAWPSASPSRRWPSRSAEFPAVPSIPPWRWD